MEKILKILGVSDQENLGERISGKSFEKLFYELIRQHEDFYKFELIWPVMTPAGAKTFRNQCIKLLPFVSNLTDNEGQKLNIRRSMLDDGFKCKIILEALARSILLQKIGESNNSIDDELNLITGLESEISSRISYKTLLAKDILGIEIPSIEFKEVLWNYFSIIAPEEFEVSYSLKKTVRKMAETVLRKPFYSDQIGEAIAKLKIEKIKKINELERLKGNPYSNLIELVQVPEYFYNLTLSPIPNNPQ